MKSIHKKIDKRLPHTPFDVVWTAGRSFTAIPSLSFQWFITQMPMKT